MWLPGPILSERATGRFIAGRNIDERSDARVVVDVERIRNEYKLVEDRLYRLRSHFGYMTVRNPAFRRLEDRARRLGRIVRQMESAWGARR